MITASERLAHLNDEFFDAMHSADPLSATVLGVAGYDARVPDLRGEAQDESVRRLRHIEAELSAISGKQLSEPEATNVAVMTELARSLRTELEDGVWAANASAGAYVSPQAIAFQAIPTAPLDSPAAVADYLERLRQLPDFFDRILDRYRQSAASGRFSTSVGVAQAVEQLEGHLNRPLPHDRLAAPLLSSGAARPSDREAARDLLSDAVRPAMARLMAGLRDELLPTARPESEVGIGFIPGGQEAYRRAVRRHTTTELSPEQIHQVGLDVLAELEEEWGEVGGRVFGGSDPAEVRRRLREDPALRFSGSQQIVDVVRSALIRAEAARDGYFPTMEIADCVVEEIDPVESGNAAMAYYRGPSEAGRPGAHCVLTTAPETRFVYEYEALAFHESVPGHHLQIASAQRLTQLPKYRRYLDAQLCAYVEGWGLYSERLADEMGLYTSDLQRLGMLSFDALRACRLVVDTGMHQLGWSRHQAVEFMWQNTATTMSNVNNEVNRYIAWPGQALAYMIGRQEIVRLRRDSERALKDRFDRRGFHGAVLGQGAVPLAVLRQVVDRWQQSFRA